jgi:hypothetical protein
MGACLSSAADTDTVAAPPNEGYTITATYPDHEPVSMAAQISCGPFGVSTGNSTRQMSSQIASTLAATTGASQGWPMNFYPTP